MACQHSADLTMTEFFFLTFNNFPGIITSNAHDDASPRKLERSRAQPVVADSPGRAPGSCSPPRKAARHRCRRQASLSARLSRALEEVQQKLAHLRCSFDIRAVSAVRQGCHPSPRYLAGRTVGIAGLSQQVV